MFLGILFILVVVYCLFVREKQRKKNIDSPTLKETNSNELFTKDEFLNSIKMQTNVLTKDIENAVHEHKKDMENKYANDLELAKKLSDFAKENSLDKAIMEIYERMRYYSEKSNNLNIYNYKKEEDKNSRGIVVKIYFEWNNTTYILSLEEQKSFTPDQDVFAYFSLLEAGEEVFKVDAFKRDNDYGDASYDSFKISVFKKKGEWFKFLLNSWKILKIEQGKWQIDSKYYGADKIKGNFSE